MTTKIELDPYEDDLEEDEPSSILFFICVFICNVVSSIFDRS